MLKNSSIIQLDSVTTQTHCNHFRDRFTIVAIKQLIKPIREPVKIKHHSKGTKTFKLAIKRQTEHLVKPLPESEVI